LSGGIGDTDSAVRRFRPDLEGLRAVAVVLVLLYHAKVPGFAGGYVGVDVFFVLSGFLITGLLYDELHSTGRISFANFYARRARRLLPAAGLVLMCTLAASAWLLSSARLSTVAADVSAAALYISNLRFGIQANDYFQASSAPSPVLHFWSLSVEEQFYIVWPAILVLAYGGFRRVRASYLRLLATMLTLGLVSLIAAVTLTGVNQPWAFFLLPTRAWELALGGVLALIPTQLQGLSPRRAGTASAIGVLLIVVAALLYDDTTPFPGYFAILPVVGAALVIAGGSRRPIPLAGRVLSLPPFRFLGRISYSVYLWHWPLIVFGSLVLGIEWVPVLALAAIPVAAATQQWVEGPFRVGRFIGTRARRNLLQAAGVGATVVVAAFAVSQVGAGPVALADLTPTLAAPLAGRAAPCPLASVRDSAACVLGRATEYQSTVVVFGDSHAQSWVPALQELADVGSWRLVNLTYGGCPSVAATVFSWSTKAVNQDCDTWREAAFSRVVAERPNLILITNSWGYALMTAGNRLDPQWNAAPPSWAAAWSSALIETLSRLAPLHARIVVMGDTPDLSYSRVDPLACVAQHSTDLGACTGSGSASIPAITNELTKAVATSHGATYIDPTPWLCGANGCPSVIGRNLVYSDGYGHLTAPFVMSLVEDLRASLPPIR
jgi:peptidoglycan/LPS O-acetylase OafA/YrhL